MFLTELKVKELPNGDKEVLSPLVYMRPSLKVYVVPKGFITNYASVPKLPLVYLVFNDLSAKAATLHDYLYSKTRTQRRTADGVFLEALKVENTPAWKRYAAYFAVRLFGGSHFKTKGGSK